MIYHNDSYDAMSKIMQGIDLAKLHIYRRGTVEEKFVESLPQEEKLGGKIVTRALQEPVRQIAINAGLEPAVILEKVKASPAGVGFDAGKEEYVDMKKAGIVDPTKVSRSALQNAASVASMILTTESIVTDKKEPKACGCGDHNDGAADMGGMY